MQLELQLITVPHCVAVVKCILRIHLKCIRREVASGHGQKQPAELKKMVGSFTEDTFGQKGGRNASTYTVFLLSFPFPLNRIEYFFTITYLGIQLPEQRTLRLRQSPPKRILASFLFILHSNIDIEIRLEICLNGALRRMKILNSWQNVQ